MRVIFIPLVVSLSNHGPSSFDKLRVSGNTGCALAYPDSRKEALVRALGLDYGERRIGTAVSDAEGRLAFPRGAIARTSLEKALEAVLRLAREEEVERIVVGLPRSLDGSLGPAALKVLAFCDALKERSPVPVETWDESFSTVEASEALRQAGVPPSRHRGRVDAAAAAVMLQRWLDHQRALRQACPERSRRAQGDPSTGSG